MSINPKNLSATAKLTFLDDFDTLSLWNGASGTWDSTYFWAPANGIEITGAQQVNCNINSNYAPTSSDAPWTISNGVLDLHAGPAPAAIQPYIDNAHQLQNDYELSFLFAIVRLLRDKRRASRWSGHVAGVLADAREHDVGDFSRNRDHGGARKRSERRL